jgi:hypothetical protein
VLWQNKENWNDLETALTSKEGSGVGIVLSTDHERDVTLLCIDFDKVIGTPRGYDIEDAGLWEHGWMEKSTSGKGYHLFLAVKTSEFKGKDYICRFFSEKFGELEAYTTGRFIALTFDEVEGSGIHDVLSKEEVEKLLGIIFVEQKKVEESYGSWDEVARFSDEEILSHGVSLNSGDKSKDVFVWVSSVVGYCASPEQVLNCFYKTSLATGEYAKNGKDKLRRTLKYMIPRLDVREKRTLASPELAFDEEDSEGATVENIVQGQLDDIKEYKLRYVKLLEQEFSCYGQVKRSVFDGVAYITHQGKHLSIESEDVVKTLRDKIRVINKFAKDKENRFKGSEVDDSMTAYRMSLKEELLLEVEQWDGEDRIKLLSTLINFHDPKRITPELFEYFLKDWSVRAVHKVMTGRGTNRMIVLQGPQGVGKDSFFSLLAGGWSEYFDEINKTSKFDGEKALFEQCVRLAVGSLRELDHYDPAQIKRLVDTPVFSFRAAYGRDVITRRNRISFLASCNPKSPFKDATGNRRFLLFAISGRADTEESATNYPQLPIAIKRTVSDQDEHFKKQVLAQAFHLWNENGKRPLAQNPIFEATMQKILEAATPEDSSLEIIEEFDEFLRGLQKERRSYGNMSKIFTKQELNDKDRFKKFCADNQMTMNAVLIEINKSGERKSKETYDKFAKNKTFFHLPGEFTREERQRYKDWLDGKKESSVVEEELAPWE